MVGKSLAQYEITAQIGAGGMGEVYRARDTRLERDVAVKVLPASFAQNAEALARFEREAKAVAALSHPNILAIHDFGKDGDTVYAVTELLEGETLRDRIQQGAVPPRKAAEIGRQIARGLGAAHGKGIVHRDLKPENIFLTQDGRVKILDFGLAREMSAPPDGRTVESPTIQQITSAGTVLGTAGYMSPEQVRGEPAGPASDIFSFGSVLYEMLAGTRAFEHDTSAETMTAILREEPAELGAVVDGLPAGLDRIVRRCLEKRPEERFQDAKDLAFALELGIDWLALSFVQRPEDVAEARALLGDNRVAVMVKVEKPAAVDRFDEILEKVDGIMVARGDLSVETPLWNVPALQKEIIRQANLHDRLAITATQMLDSMQERPRPTRAEVVSAARSLQPALEACGGAFRGVVMVRLAVRGSTGRGQAETVTTRDVPPATRECVERAVSGFRVEPFNEEVFRVSYPFRLGP